MNGSRPGGLGGNLYLERPRYALAAKIATNVRIAAALLASMKLESSVRMLLGAELKIRARYFVMRNSLGQGNSILGGIRLRGAGISGVGIRQYQKS